MLIRYRPNQIGAFEFAVLASRRAEQLSHGCVPRVEGGHTVAVTALLEVMSGKVARADENSRHEPADGLVRTETSAATDAQSE